LTRAGKERWGMPTYLVTFRLAPNGTSDARHDSLIDQFQGNEWWAETGSTIVVNDEASIDDFCDRVFTRSKLDERMDMAVVFDLNTRDARAHGSFVDYGLFHIAPWVEKV
jgi:hypothetical protein